MRERLPVTVGLLLTLIVIPIVVAMAGTGQEWLLGMLHTLEQGARENFMATLVIFVGAFALLATLTLPIATLFCLAGGYLFGIPVGFLAALAGATAGAAVTFLLARLIGGPGVRRRLLAGRAERWLIVIERDATWYLILLRIVPIAPFFAVNAAAGVTGIGFVHFMVATTIGLIPTTIVYSAVGAGLNSLVDARDMLGPQMLLRPGIGLPLLGLGLIIAASWIFRRRFRSA